MRQSGPPQLVSRVQTIPTRCSTSVLCPVRVTGNDNLAQCPMSLMNLMCPFRVELPDQAFITFMSRALCLGVPVPHTRVLQQSADYAHIDEWANFHFGGRLGAALRIGRGPQGKGGGGMGAGWRGPGGGCGNRRAAAFSRGAVGAARRGEGPRPSAGRELAHAHSREVGTGAAVGSGRRWAGRGRMSRTAPAARSRPALPWPCSQYG